MLSFAEILAEMAKRIFSSGFAWTVIEKKWPGFEEAFLGFDPGELVFQPDDFWDARLSDKRIVRNGQKIMAVRRNADVDRRQLFGGKLRGIVPSPLVGEGPGEGYLRPEGRIKTHLAPPHPPASRAPPSPTRGEGNYCDGGFGAWADSSVKHRCTSTMSDHFPYLYATACSSPARRKPQASCSLSEPSLAAST